LFRAFDKRLCVGAGNRLIGHKNPPFTAKIKGITKLQIEEGIEMDFVPFDNRAGEQEHLAQRAGIEPRPRSYPHFMWLNLWISTHPFRRPMIHKGNLQLIKINAALLSSLSVAR
jgi:hypothetical protein